ncbi:MAG: hypothetical protein MUC96_07310 [Myxococcaceae bacterium]|nr:hypothetical protein [Myxococcaceae bacterium]
MKRQNPRRRQTRGMAMLAALACLLLVSVLAAGLFLQTRDAGTLNSVTTAQTVAALNAEMGLQEAIRRVRAAQINTLAFTGTCTAAEVEANTCTSLFTVGPVIGPNDNPLQGGGLLYQFVVYRPTPAPEDLELLARPNRYVVRSTGFFGQNVNAVGLVTSIVEAEVEIGNATSVPCVGGYDCVGG